VARHSFTTTAEYKGTLGGRLANDWREWSVDKHPAVGYAAAVAAVFLRRPVLLAATTIAAWLLFSGWPWAICLAVAAGPQLAWTGRHLAGLLGSAPRPRGLSQILSGVSMMVRVRRAWRVAARRAGVIEPDGAGSPPRLRDYHLTQSGMSATVDSGHLGLTDEEIASLADRVAASALPSNQVRWALQKLPERWTEKIPMLVPAARYATVAALDGMGTVTITWMFLDPLRELIPVTALVRTDATMWAIGTTEHSQPAMTWKHLPILVVGMSGSGKSNLLWTIIMSQLLSGEPFKIWAFDPKGGVEFNQLRKALGQGMVEEYARDRKEIRDLAVKLFNRMEMREHAMAATDERFHVPTVQEPRILVPIDELVTVYEHLVSGKPNLEATFATFLSRARAAGISVVCATTTPFGHSIGEKVRDKFPVKIVGHINDTFVTSAMFGRHAEALGVRATQIRNSTPGVFYLHMNEWPQPVRMRTPYLTDEMVELLAQGKLPDGLVLANVEEHPEVEAPMGLKANRTQYLYRWDTPPEGVKLEDGTIYRGLLYVGISIDVATRITQHLSNRQKKILNTVGVTCRVDREWTAMDCADDIIAGRTVEQVAQDYEKHMISTEHPLLNIAHNGRRKTKELTRG
jgi:predicted GIY-YIG superfamily endonuclease